MELIFAPNKIEIWPMERVVPYAANAKIHGDEQVDKIAKKGGLSSSTVQEIRRQILGISE